MDNGDKGPAGARDGLIDFRGYTTEQLAELESSIDPESFPLNHTRLVEELKRRERAEAPDSPSWWDGWPPHFASKRWFVRRKYFLIQFEGPIQGLKRYGFL